MKDKKWEASYMPGDDSEKDPSKKGFNSEAEAWKYIKSQLCKQCEEDIKTGYMEVTNGYDIEKFPVNHPGDTMCGAEWWVILEEDDV